MAQGKYEYWLTEEGLLLLEGWAREGITDEQIADKMGICRDTLIQWKKKYPDISDTLKKGKEIVDTQVENALLKKTMGYIVPLKKTFKVKHIEYDEITGKKIAEKEVLETGYDEVYVPADTTAQIFWLKNRRPDKWKDKPKYEGDSNEKTNEDIITLADLINKPQANRDIKEFETDE